MKAQSSFPSDLRWSDYVLAHDGDDIEQLWQAACAKRQAVYIMAEGFDPRTITGLRRFLASGAYDKVRVIAIALPPTKHELALKLASENIAERTELIAKHDAELVTIPYPQVSEPRAAGQRIAHSVIQAGHFTGAHHVVLDVSAMPTSIYFALAGGVLAHCEKSGECQEIQIVVCDNPSMDAAITNVGTAAADAINGFTNGLDLEAGSKQVRIWAPVLGHGEGLALRAIRDRLEAREICPVLPFPAGDPRRGDDLALGYRQLLFEEMQVNPGDIIYADERNPFDLYRTLSRLNAKFAETLRPLGEVKVILSAHSSKLLSLGVLLAAYEHHLPVVSAPPTTWSLSPDFDREQLSKHDHLVCLWIEGSPYR
jgi:hypothetical protein